ncbi:patatin-like phospholipase family protein [Flavobacterium salilacus subsp. salilacus]|uniref:patatin-like phospholipase family protein n=1 Tax=Flavobacterium TaxID=237 RepID=UPI001075625C|nr:MULTISPECIES: patatin-like phospholipase family protein [Flavobacterium]KAF2519895.1 patatin-like phospholipase family protein [Flavobacterium salilacus subsp. salilacus]MBE1614198.1 patatin-like phospholipase family protein [Flavobacterium sp. SaA2.13]
MENDTFRVGLCMAGAVSAGAYTAGVVDYLLEALQEWEKQRGNPGIPTHKVAIPVIGGASAGGMTGIITASALEDEITPVPVPQQKDILKEHPENRFYNAWVDLLGEDMFVKMLGTSDIKKNDNVVALLNSQFIDEIADKVTTIDHGRPKPPRAYFETPVKIFTTLSNLKGFDYNVDFNADVSREKYVMTVHNDYACFGLYDTPEEKAKIEEGWIPLSFRNNDNVETAKDAAMATGAFPIGLESRELNRKANDVYKSKWLKNYFPNAEDSTADYKTLNVDGGMINNEPFEKVREVLDDITKAQSSKIKDDEVVKMNTDYNTFVNTVLMIDPFPSKSKDDKTAFSFEKDMLSVFGKLLTAVTNQMKVKPEDYMLAMQEGYAGQFLISPSRFFKDPDGNTVDAFGENAIACGTLAGFGGFISKEFRVHDYYLGRFNCEIFLRDYFTVPEEALTKNPIFRNGYAGINIEDFKSSKDNYYQIIPIFSKHPGEDYFPMPTFSNGSNWPVIKEDVIDKLKPHVKRRVQKVTINIVKLNFVNRALLFIGSKVVLNRMLTDKIINSIKESMITWKLMDKK